VNEFDETLFAIEELTMSRALTHVGPLVMLRRVKGLRYSTRVTALRATHFGASCPCGAGI
jgi:hypothetical protein